jgi:DNA-binding NarL/FixJ family response regulator
VSTRVLVVDDHLVFAEALEASLKADPRFDVVAIATTGPQAVGIARATQPDVVLLDFHLPGYSADEGMPRLREAAPNAKVLILTSDTSDQTWARAVRAGAVGCVTKDKGLSEIEDAIVAAREGRPLISAERLQRVLESMVAPGRPTTETGEQLTEREVEILLLLADGKDNQAIADALFISPHTVRTHLQNIFSKMGVHSKLEAVTLAAKTGLLRTSGRHQPAADLLPRGPARAP